MQVQREECTPDSSGLAEWITTVEVGEPLGGSSNPVRSLNVVRVPGDRRGR